MTNSLGVNTLYTWLGIVALLFALLLLAVESTEMLRQIVLLPDSAAQMGISANCRADELEEEGLSLAECELMVSNVNIVLQSNPSWFRSFRIILASLTMLTALYSAFIAGELIRNRQTISRTAPACFGTLLLLDVIGFIAALNTGPLLRAQILTPTLLWFFIHLCLMMAALSLFTRGEQR